MPARFTISTFQGMSALPTQWALDRGLFAQAGLNVEIDWARSSGAQLKRLERDEVLVAHTSADNVFGPAAPADAIIVGEWAAGRLLVVADSDRVEAGGPWAVDSPESGFSLVLRAILADRLDVRDPELIAVGASLQRLAAVAEGTAVGTILAPGFEQQASQLGLTLVGEQADLGVTIMTDGIMIRRSRGEMPTVDAYLATWRRAADAVASAALADLSACVAAAGMTAMFPDDYLAHIRATTGMASYLPARYDALEGLAALRRRYLPGWVANRASLADYLS